MNKNELEIMLKTLLIGQELDLSKYSNRTCESVLRKLNYVGMSYRYDNRYCHFYYRGKSLFGFKVKTKQEYKHERYSDRFYAYIIQSLELLSYSCENIEQRMKEIDNKIENDQAEKEREIQEMFGIYKQLHVFWGEETNRIIDYLKEHKYEFAHMLKSEEKE